MSLIFNIVVVSLVLNVQIVLSYGVTNREAASSSADLVIGFNLSGSGTNLIHTAESSSYGANAYSNERKIVEVRRVSSNEVDSRNNYGKDSINSALSGDKYSTNNENKGQTQHRSSYDHQSQSTQTQNTGTNVNSVTGLDNDAIIFPDTVAKYIPKDSYGNPVTPYTTLPDEPVSISAVTSDIHSQIGHKTDVNKDSGVSQNDNLRPNSNNSPQSSQPNVDSTLGFVLPSYANGITKLETYPSGTVTVRPSLEHTRPSTNLQPPLSSGNYNYPQLNTQNRETKKITTTTTTTTTERYTPVTNQYNHYTGSNTPITNEHNHNIAQNTPTRGEHNHQNNAQNIPITNEHNHHTAHYHESSSVNNAHTNAHVGVVESPKTQLNNNDNNRQNSYNSQTTNSQQTYSTQTQTNDNSRNYGNTQTHQTQTQSNLNTDSHRVPAYNQAIIFPTLEPPNLHSVSTYDSGVLSSSSHVSNSNTGTILSSGTNYGSAHVNHPSSSVQSVQPPSSNSNSNYGRNVDSSSSNNNAPSVHPSSVQNSASSYGSNTQRGSSAPSTSAQHVPSSSSYTTQNQRGSSGVQHAQPNSGSYAIQNDRGSSSSGSTYGQDSGSYGTHNQRSSSGSSSYQEQSSHLSSSKYVGGFGGAPDEYPMVFPSN